MPCPGRRRHERGAVTAEMALVMPLLAAVTVGLLWMLVVASAQIRTIDAAREAARMVARGDSRSDAVEVAQRIAPDGAQVQVQEDGRDFSVTVSARIAPPGGLFSRAGVRVASTSVAAGEEDAEEDREGDGEFGE